MVIMTLACIFYMYIFKVGISSVCFVELQKINAKVKQREVVGADKEKEHCRTGG